MRDIPDDDDECPVSGLKALLGSLRAIGGCVLTVFAATRALRLRGSTVLG